MKIIKMPEFRVRCLILTGIIVSFSFWSSPIRSQETEKKSEETVFNQSVTNKDITIPVEDLKLLVKPLSVDELEIEADAWFRILKNKVQEISYAEIAINKENRAIDAEEEAASGLKQAQEALLQAEEAKKNASPGSSEYENAAKQVEEAKEKLKEVEESISDVLEIKKELEKDENLSSEIEKAKEDLEIEEAKTILEKAKTTRDELEAGSKPYEVITTQIDALDNAIVTIEKAKKALEGANPESEDYQKLTKEIEKAREELKKAREAIDGKASTEKEEDSLTQLEETTEVLEKSDDIKVDSETKVASNNTVKPEENLQEKGEQLEKAAEQLEEDSEKAIELKQQLIATVTALQGEQTGIIDRFTVILDEFETKGGDPASYKKYIETVSTIRFDIQDTGGLGIRVISWLKSEEGGLRLLINFGKFAGVIIIVSIASQIAGNMTKRLLGKVDAVSNIFTEFIVTIIKRGGVVVAILLGFAVTGVNLGPVLALVGGASFVLAFALQSNLGNFASGLMLILNKPFDVGDEIKVAGYWAYVDSISLATTKLQGFDGSMVTLPNNTVWGGDIINYTHADNRKHLIYLYFKFTQDMDQIYKMWIELASSHPKVLNDPAPGWFPWNGHYEYYVCIGLSAWTKKDDYWGVYIELLKMLQKRLEELDIELARPIQEIKFDQSSEDAIAIKPSSVTK